MPGGQSTQIIRRLSQAQWRSGQKPEAIRTLRRWLEKHPDDRMIKVFLGSYLAATNRVAEATALFKELIKSNPNSWLVQNEIAWTLYEAGDANQALAYAQRARELAPQNPLVADTMAVILLEIGNHPQGLALLREAAEKLPDDLNVHLHLAEALVKNDLRDEARRVLTDVLAAKKDFDGKSKAAALLKKLEDGS
jgi:predicted Zn-dependent protease